MTQLYLDSDQDRWFRNNFSDEDKLTGTVYTDINQTTAKDLTGYTIKVILTRRDGPGRHGDFLGATGSIVTADEGTWDYAMREQDVPPRGVYWMAIQLTKSGTRITTLNRVEFHILEGAASP